MIYPWVVRQHQAKPGAYTLDQLMGVVIAHELGHLLFGHNRHSEGIMRPRYEAADQRALAQRRLLFTRAQADALREGLDRRPVLLAVR